MRRRQRAPEPRLPDPPEDDACERHQRRMWRVQRAGQIAMALTVALALLGVFGRGAASAARSGDAGLTVEYDRVVRLSGPTRLRLLIGAPAAPRDTARLFIGRAAVDAADDLTLIPQPESAIAGASGITYIVRTSSEGRPTPVIVHLRPRRPGWIDGEASVDGKDRVRFRQLVLP